MKQNDCDKEADQMKGIQMTSTEQKKTVEIG